MSATVKIDGRQYTRINEQPAVRRWDTPASCQGQMVQYSYSAEGRAESGPGAKYVRITDRSSREVEYYRLSK